MDLFSMYVLFFHIRPRDVLQENSFFQMTKFYFLTNTCTVVFSLSQEYFTNSFIASELRKS